jgi:hypothetical protein
METASATTLNTPALIEGANIFVDIESLSIIKLIGTNSCSPVSVPATLIRSPGLFNIKARIAKATVRS